MLAILPDETRDCIVRSADGTYTRLVADSIEGHHHKESLSQNTQVELFKFVGELLPCAFSLRQPSAFFPHRLTQRRLVKQGENFGGKILRIICRHQTELPLPYQFGSITNICNHDRAPNAHVVPYLEWLAGAIGNAVAHRQPTEITGGEIETNCFTVNWTCALNR